MNKEFKKEEHYNYIENIKLELTHQNGKKSELIPLSFTYTAEDHSLMEFDLSSLTCMPKTNYIKDDISKFYEIFGKSSWPKLYHINSFVCNFNENDEIHNILKLLCGHKKMKPRNLLMHHKQDIVSKGKIQIETIDELEKFPVISYFQLHNCVPISVDYDNNTIEISMDYIELTNTPKIILYDYAKKHNAVDYEICGTSISCGPHFDRVKINTESKCLMMDDSACGYGNDFYEDLIPKNN